ncbi:hypothetical protein EF_2921 [Enterococcus faecalis V583]|uniref:Uncharacterized protein n=1 Tax=Enterococcus faecalis (strain ATCC 700802 / V583) TaxID=226185 RepID=Q82ZX6_ENTFA|nr:hypothetical protein EF_2921 [Enterococcus faecalis V583]
MPKANVQEPRKMKNNFFIQRVLSVFPNYGTIKRK